MKPIIPVITILALTLTACTPSAKSATTALYFTSSPTSWVGQGETKLFTTNGFGFGGDIQLRSMGNAGISETLRLWLWNNGDPLTDSIMLNVGTEPGDQVLALDRYENAARSGGWTTYQPHIDFIAWPHGNNITSGWFEILELVRGPNGSVASAAVDFVQYDEGVAAKWVAGSWRHNSSVPINTSIPEPSRAMLTLIGAASLLARRRRALA